MNTVVFLVETAAGLHDSSISCAERMVRHEPVPKVLSGADRRHPLRELQGANGALIFPRAQEWGRQILALRVSHG